MAESRGTFYPSPLPMRSKHRQDDDTKASCSCSKDIKDILRAFRRMPNFSELGKKPPKSTMERIEDLAQRSCDPNILLSLIATGIERIQNNTQPTNNLENSLFNMLQQLPLGPREALDDFVNGLRQAPPEIRKLIIEPLDGEITLDLLAPKIAEEAAQVLPQILPDWVDPDRFGPGRVRPYPLDLGEFGGRIEVVDPTICTIMGLRRATYVPEPVPWGDHELERDCRVVENAAGDPTVECGRFRQGTRGEPCPAGATSEGVCLRVPEVPHGTTLMITGFNFVSYEARVRLRDPVDPMIEYVSPARVVGDGSVPVEEISTAGEADIICDCRVQDTLYFDLPTHWDPARAEEVMAGDYPIRIEFKNPGDHFDTVSVFSSLRMPPEWLVSKWDMIRVLPPEDFTGRITLDEVWCDEMTDGLGADDLLLRVSGFTINGGITSRILPTPPPFRHDDFDSREAFADRPPPGFRRAGPSLNQVIFEGPVPDFVVLNVIGFEVEDLELARQAILDFDEAFVYAIEWFWDNVLSLLPEDVLEDIGSAIEELDFWGWALIILGVLVTAGIMALWAAISIPDVILLEFLPIPKTHFYFLTHPRNPLPPPTPEIRFGESPDQVRVTAAPVSKLANDYIEARRHRNEDEDSTYRLIVRYSRI